MNRPLRVLIVEDSERDSELLLRELVKAGYEPLSRRVESLPSMVQALEEQSWDIVFSDWSMPGFSGLAALHALTERELDVPFIILSGTIGEEVAVEALRAGAHDFLLKNKLARLVPALERELREAAIRRERRGMQEQLMISERMASVGILAAGVAHEINNPLASVLANLELALHDVGELSKRQPAERHVRELREELTDAHASAERIRNIVRDLKMFSRSDDEKRSSVDVRSVLDSSLRLAWNEVRHRARLVKNYQDVPLIEANESRLGQAFLNLIINAAQSIPEGRAESNEIRIETLVDSAGRTVVEISDTGCGIAPQVLKRLFTPFFTTKPVGVGTGLGLSICHRIITTLGGEISVESSLGKGSRFRVSLPSGPRVQESGASPVSCAPAPRRRGRVLVVDDETMIVNTVRRTLARDHDVVTLERADQALTRIEGGARFDVILCDLMMPEMTGMDLHAELLRVAPEQADRMIFLSGGAFTAGARAFLDRVVNLRLDKPFDVSALRAIVNDRVR